MRYVTITGDVVTGAFANLQPGLAEIEADDAVQPGWRLVDGVLVDPATLEPTLDEQLAALDAALAATTQKLKEEYSDATFIDGAQGEARVTALRAARNQALADYTDAVDALPW